MEMKVEKNKLTQYFTSQKWGNIVCKNYNFGLYARIITFLTVITIMFANFLIIIVRMKTHE